MELEIPSTEEPVAGLEEMLMHLGSILQMVPKEEQLFSYDTTFSMGDFYVYISIQI